MKKVDGVVFLALIAAVILAGCLYDQWSPQSVQVAGWDHAAFVDYLREAFAPTEDLLAQTGDELDFERFRFFSGKDINGKDETVVVIPLTSASTSYRLAYRSEGEAPLAEIAPLPFAGFLSLDPSTCFSVLENGVPYIYRIVTYDKAELVDAKGAFVRHSTEFSWTHRGNPNEGEWYTYLGNIKFHFGQCTTTSTNQK